MAMTQVLLVDDDVELGEMLAEYLEREGFGAAAVADGEAGVRGALSGAYDIVVLDVMMPRLNGIEALRQIRLVRGRTLLDKRELRSGERYEVSLRLRLDTTQLPKPLQVNTLVSREWSLASDWYRVVLTP